MTKSNYIPSTDLINATKVAFFLNRPLLLTGEPGTGKTTYANYLQESENRKLFIFNTKSVSQARDLFYHYDAVAHFANKERSALEFITLEALGKAIVNAIGKAKVKDLILNQPNNNNQISQIRQSPDKEENIDNFLIDCDDKSAIVLIDEIDKAPRDFPNDILNEIEKLEFKIKELGLNFNLLDEIDRNKIMILLTSNFEKNLPDAFLRRCLFFHIDFPDKLSLNAIIKAHISTIDEKLLEIRLNEIVDIRNKDGISKKPATSEIIDCIKWLCNKNELNQELHSNKVALATLIKKNDDFNLIYKAKS
jgi:MoxR-like ATPase